jgi:hypothetical protein
MPRGDGTGPAGFGPMTGRRAGYCAGYAVPGFANPYPRGGGRGRGYRRMYYATGVPGWARAPYGASGYGVPAYAGEPAPASQKEMLNNQAAMLKEQLTQIEARLEELEEE